MRCFISQAISQIIEKFDELLQKSKTTKVRKWSDLEIGTVYIIRSYRDVNTVNGPSRVLTIKGFGEVWCEGDLAEKIADKKYSICCYTLGLNLSIFLIL